MHAIFVGVGWCVCVFVLGLSRVLMRCLGRVHAFKQFLVKARFARWAQFSFAIFFLKISCRCLGRVGRCSIFDNTSSPERRCALTH